MDWHILTAKPYTRLSDALPAPEDADQNSDVLYLRSDVPTLGKWDKIPIDATHWRHTDRWLTECYQEQKTD